MSIAQPFYINQLDLRVSPCPLCGGVDFTQLARHDRNLLGVTTVGCRGCGLMQTNPRPTAAGLEVFYRDHYRLFYQGATAPDAAYIASLNKDIRLAYTAKYFAETIGIAKSATVLDFGCGEGSLFAALRKAGFTGAFYGVELNASFGEYASQYGNAIVSNAIRSREPVDLVVINHVLEHLEDPVEVLRKIGTLMNPSGHLYIDVPDAEEYGGIYDLHLAHILHFTKRTLLSLVERSGFTVEHVEKHRPPHHPPSIRLIGSPGLVAKPTELPSYQLETRAWDAVRAAGKFQNTIRLRLRKIDWLRKLYLMAKSSSLGSTSDRK